MSDEKDDTYNGLSRSDVPFWSSYVKASSGALTLEMMRDFANSITTAEPRPMIITTSISVIEGAGRGIGWPELEAHFEELARGAAHSIFGNIALDIRSTVTPMAAGRYAIGGEWPFSVAEWSEPRRYEDLKR